MSAPSAVQSMTWALAGCLGEGVRDAVPSGPSNVEFQTFRGALDALFGKRCATCQEARKATPKMENHVFAIYGAPTRFSPGLYLVLAELREATFFSPRAFHAPLPQFQRVLFPLGDVFREKMFRVANLLY